MTRISAVVKWRSHELNVAWEDGVLSGDEAAVALAQAGPWRNLAPPISPHFPTPIENPYTVPLVFEHEFDEVVSIEGVVILPPGDLIFDKKKPRRRKARGGQGAAAEAAPAKPAKAAPDKRGTPTDQIRAQIAAMRGQPDDPDGQ